MAFEVRVPRLGWSMEEGVFVGWLKRDGDLVRPGEPLFELEGEKAIQAVEALDEGVLRTSPDLTPGAVVPVGGLLGHLVPAAELSSWPDAASPAPPAASPAVAATTPHAVTNGPTASALPDPPASPSVRRLAREFGVPLHSVAGSGPSSRITRNDVTLAASETRSAAPATRSSPRARRLAKELEVDWRSLRGSGRSGRVREADVRAAADSRVTASPSRSETPLSPGRRAIATQMRASRRRTVAVTLHAQADATNLVSLRRQFKAKGDAAPVPAFTDIVAAVAAAVLKAHPHMAGRWDAAAETVILPGDDDFHIGIAVDTDQGLLVPVIRNIPALTLPQIVARTKELIDQARRGRLAAADMTGGVFTITNLGAYSIDGFTPVINYPETAILGLGGIRREPVVDEDDRVTTRDRLTLSLTFDHCRVDGAPAARFLRDLRLAIENPAAWLL